MTQQHFVMHRDIRIISTTGHAIAFKAGKPTPVPKILHKEVMEKGGVPCDASGVIVDAKAAAAVVPEKKVLVGMPEDPVEREEAVLGAIRQIVERNNPKDFAGGGTPAATACTLLLGWKVDAKDVRRVWEKHRADLVKEARK